MAAVTTALAAGTALAGMGMNIGQAVKANKQAKAAAGAADAAAKQIANIKEQNAFNRVQVPTLGFDRVREGLDRTTTAALGAAQGAGAEGVIGVLRLTLYRHRKTKSWRWLHRLERWGCREICTRLRHRVILMLDRELESSS